MCKYLLLGAVLLGLFSTPLIHAESPVRSDATASQVVIERENANRCRILIPARRGTIDWSDVVCGVARAQQLDSDVLRPLLPRGRLHIDRPTTRLQLLSLNMALPGIEFRLVHGKQQAASGLEIVIDRDDFEARRRVVTSLLRYAANREGKYDAALAYGLNLEADATNQPEKPLVVVLHGFNSRPHYMEGLAKAIQAKNLVCTTYGYPNDEPIRTAARRLSTTLKKHASQYPQQKIILVTNSMGGLVARAVIEDPELDSSNVQQLIMIAPPNHGSQLARIAHGLDLWEYLLSDAESDEISWCRASIADGLAEANRDLRPDSPFLRALNARERNGRVRYTILLGTGGRMTAQRLENLRAALKTASEQSRSVRLFYPLADDFLRDLDEVVAGRGDGAVAVKRGRLEGVADVAVLGFGHSAALGHDSKHVDQNLLDAVLARLPGE